LTVKEHGCAIGDLQIRATNSIRGAVFDEDSQTVQGIRVSLYRRDGPKAWGKSVATNLWGEFSLENIHPGSYDLVVSPRGATATSPYDTAYFGGEEERETAALIEVQADSRLTGYNIEVGPRYATRQITALISWPDGKPARSWIGCTDATDAATRFPRSEAGDEVAVGRYRCTVLADRPYLIEAFGVLSAEDSLAVRRAIVPSGANDVRLDFVFSEAAYEQYLEEQAHR